MASSSSDSSKRSDSGASSSKWDRSDTRYACSSPFTSAAATQIAAAQSDPFSCPTVCSRHHSQDSHNTRRYNYDEDKRQERDDRRERPYSRSDERTRFPRDGEGRQGGDRWGGRNERSGEAEAPVEPPKANFKVSGALAAAARTTDTGIVLKFAAPEDARTPSLKWRLFPFKGEEALEPIVIHEKSLYLLGRDRDVCDVPLDHPSCSTQHAVIVHRQVTKKDPTTGLNVTSVQPYLIDLESKNGTFLNDVRCDDSRPYQLLEKDCIRFGASSREYVLLNERSK